MGSVKLWRISGNEGGLFYESGAVNEPVIHLPQTLGHVSDQTDKQA